MTKLLKKVIYFIICITIYSSSVFAQDTNADPPIPRPANTATLVGIGGSNLYDTYLSPLEYKGTSIRIIHERIKQSSWFDNKFTRQQIIELELADGENPAKNAKEYWLMLAYNWGGHYNLVKTHNFRFSAGAILNASIGVLYNERNSNNPASARAYGNLNLSAIAFYNWKWMTFRWQLDSPVMGILFSPHYGQSYYEMSLGNTVGTAHFASLHNQRALRSYLTADFPVGNITFRVGYLGSFYQTKVNELQTHTYSNSFIAGIVFESIGLSGNKRKNYRQIKSSYYFD